MRIWTVVGRKKRGAGGTFAKAEVYRLEVRAETAQQALNAAVKAHPKYGAEVIDSRETL